MNILLFIESDLFIAKIAYILARTTKKAKIKLAISYRNINILHC